jgi:hypothetical protein
MILVSRRGRTRYVCSRVLRAVSRRRAPLAHPHSFLHYTKKPFYGDLGIFSDLTVVNVLARVVMKNVANCDIQYELRSFGNY